VELSHGERQTLLNYLIEHPIIRSKELDALGISREVLRRLVQEGEVIQLGRGIYTHSETELNEHSQLAEISKRVPHGVICLISALHFHNLSTQIPFEIWIALEKGRGNPQISYPPLQTVHLSGAGFHQGIVHHTISGVTVPIYNIPKTVIDCFKFRNKIGLDVALESLREALRHKHTTRDQLWKMAKACRMSSVIKPYLEIM